VHETCPASDLSAAGEQVVEPLLLAGPEAVAIAKQLIEASVETPSTEPSTTGSSRRPPSAAAPRSRGGPRQLPGEA
jgi:hypothetical protein